MVTEAEEDRPPLLLLVVKALALEDVSANSALVMRVFFSIMIEFCRSAFSLFLCLFRMDALSCSNARA